MDDQLVPIAMVINVVVRNSRFNNAGTAFAGLHSRYPKSQPKDGVGGGLLSLNRVICSYSDQCVHCSNEFAHTAPIRTDEL